MLACGGHLLYYLSPLLPKNANEVFKSINATLLKRSIFAKSHGMPEKKCPKNIPWNELSILKVTIS
jgi:hypothetical protein